MGWGRPPFSDAARCRHGGEMDEPFEVICFGEDGRRNLARFAKEVKSLRTVAVAVLSNYERLRTGTAAEPDTARRWLITNGW